MDTGGPFPGAKARPVCDGDHSPPPSVEVENESELYLLSQQAPPWGVVGQQFFAFHVKALLCNKTLCLW
jgi:hypothetical protein